MSSSPDSKRVVVTGIGPISSIGFGKEEFWNSLLNGKSGTSKITSINASGFHASVGGEIKNFDISNFVSTKKDLDIGRTSQLGMAAAKLALLDSGISGPDLANSNVAIIMGTTNGESKVIENIADIWLEKGDEFIESADVLRYPANVISLNIARQLRITADCMVIPTACAAGNYSIGYGHDLIKAGKSSIVIAGGSDAFSRIALMGFDRLFAIAPEKCQPFDKNRKGIIIGEGSGILVLESLDRARKRKARIYAEILGYALSCDASHMTTPSLDGVTDVMEKALQDSLINSDAVDYISAHGTGTIMNDKVESAAINKVFNKKFKKVPVSSIKSMLGHTMGAASALEAIACVMAIYDSKIPPTINHEVFDDQCDIDCVPNQMRDLDVKIALNNSFAFGGNNACLVFSKILK